MKKTYLFIMMIVLTFSFLCFPAAAEENVTVLKVISDFEAYDSTADLLTDSNSKGFIYGIQAPKTKVELVKESGNKRVKVSPVGPTNQYIHLKTGSIVGLNIASYKADGMRMYVKTQDSGIVFVIRVDGSVKSATGGMGFFGNMILVDMNGKETDYFSDSHNIYIPANFEGYIMMPFDGSYINLGGESDLMIEEIDSLKNLVFFLSPDPSVDEVFANNEVFFFDNIELYKANKTTKTPTATPTPTPTATATPTPTATATATAVETTAAPTTTAPATTAPAQASVTPSADTVTDAPNSGWIIYVVIGLVVIATAAVLFFILKRRKAGTN